MIHTPGAPFRLAICRPAFPAAGSAFRGVSAVSVCSECRRQRAAGSGRMMLAGRWCTEVFGRRFPNVLAKQYSAVVYWSESCSWMTRAASRRGRLCRTVGNAWLRSHRASRGSHCPGISARYFGVSNASNARYAWHRTIASGLLAC